MSGARSLLDAALPLPPKPPERSFSWFSGPVQPAEEGGRREPGQERKDEPLTGAAEGLAVPRDGGAPGAAPAPAGPAGPEQTAEPVSADEPTRAWFTSGTFAETMPVEPPAEAASGSAGAPAEFPAAVPAMPPITGPGTPPATGTVGSSVGSDGPGVSQPSSSVPPGDPAEPYAPGAQTGAAAEREPYQTGRRAASSGVPLSGSGRPSAESLDPDTLLKGRKKGPSRGWRRAVYTMSGGLINPGEPPDVRRRHELIARARTPVAGGHHRVAVLSLKGGVGKTTTTVGLGATLAQVRGDRVIAVDANPDRGTLSDKVELETSATVRDLLNERAQVKRYADIRAFTSQTPSRLEILASDRDPSVSEAFSGEDYQAVAEVLENFYSICITDCGTGLLHSAMSGVLRLADQIVLVSSPSVDGARAASATLDWLEAHGYGDLVRAATVVLCNVRPRSKSKVDLKKLQEHFAARCRAVVRVPYDPHLEEGAEIDLERLQQATRDAYLELAACVGDGFAGPRSQRGLSPALQPS
ncbi:MinD/ParA family ATP-binding protein [Thermobispora bispora]|uniref:MinD/ParA family ATP-binding protein n=1 Tax=Thermobispora bispora TaxID=2006 RepID=UPI001F11C223|nr:AAA family ATPase [Thermobispora bispora]